MAQIELVTGKVIEVEQTREEIINTLKRYVNPHLKWLDFELKKSYVSKRKEIITINMNHIVSVL